jgi:hypothetical protein
MLLRRCFINSLPHYLNVTGPVGATQLDWQVPCLPIQAHALLTVPCLPSSPGQVLSTLGSNCDLPCTSIQHNMITKLKTYNRPARQLWIDHFINSGQHKAMCCPGLPMMSEVACAKSAGNDSIMRTSRVPVSAKQPANTAGWCNFAEQHQHTCTQHCSPGSLQAALADILISSK